MPDERQFDAVKGYQGQSVDRPLLEQALNFLIALEHDQDTDTPIAAHPSSTEDMSLEIAKANAILRKYGEQITEPSLERMESVFFEIADSYEYSRNFVIKDIVCSSLSAAWIGIGEWKV